MRRSLKPSFYNIVIAKKDGIAVYNTRTGHLVRAFGDEATIVSNCLEKKKIEYDESNLYISELLKHGILVDYSINEIELVENSEKSCKYGDNLKLIILPTEQCNFRCVYCYERFNRGRMSKKTQKSLIKYVENEIDKYSGLNVIWFGGEPTEALDIIKELSEQMIEICKRKKKAYSAGISTNGYNLSLDVFKKLKSLHVTDYQITIDGIPEIHDRQRVLRSGGKTFDTIIDNLKQIKQNIKSSVVSIVIRSNISREMVEKMDDYCKIINENFKDDRRFKYMWQLVGDYGYVRDESIKEIFGRIKDYELLVNKYAEWFINSYMLALYGPDGGVCYAMKRNSFVIDSAGTIRKCTCDLETDANSFGVIGESWDETKHETWLRSRDIDKNSKCYECVKRPMCHNRQCYKADKCLVNYMFLNQILDAMSERADLYDVIKGV